MQALRSGQRLMRWRRTLTLSRLRSQRIMPSSTASRWANPVNARCDRRRWHRHPLIAEMMPFDLVIANILAGPLIDMAADITGLLASDGGWCLRACFRPRLTMSSQPMVPMV